MASAFQLRKSRGWGGRSSRWSPILCRRNRGPGSASRWCARSPKSTAAASKSKARRASARASRCAFPWPAYRQSRRDTALSPLVLSRYRPSRPDFLESFMLLWAGLALGVAGLLALFIDVRAAEYFRPHLVGAWRRRVWLVTDVAKGAHWLGSGFFVYGGVQLWMAIEGETPAVRRASDLALALLVSMLVASAILHSIKLILGRRRPRDHFEHGLYGLRWLALDHPYDFFPSRHP